MNILTQSTDTKMTSQQIADLVGSRHDTVKKSIERLATDKPNKPAVIQLPPMTEVKQNQSLSPNSKTAVYVFSGEQGRLDSIVVVAQLSPEFTAALVKRWDELERGVSQPVVPEIELPKDYLSALKALVSSEEEKQVIGEQLAIAAPKAAALDTLSHVKGALGIRETAKAVGIPEREFVRRCLNKDKPMSSRFLYRDDDGKLNAYSHRIKQGFMSQKITSYQGRNGHNFVTIQVKFTAAGVAHVAKLMQNKPVSNLRVLEAV